MTNIRGQTINTENIEQRLSQASDDPELWLAYGDELLRRGDVRAALVRLERRLCEEGLSVKEQRALRREIKVIHSEHERAWLEGWEIPAGIALEWRYGVIIGARLAASVSAEVRRLVSLPVARLLCTLQIDGPDHDTILPVLEILAGGTVKSLVLLGESERLGTRGARVVARAEGLRTLRSLSLVGNSIGVEGAREFALSECIGGLSSLDLGWNDIGDKGAQAIAQARPETLGALSCLKLSANGISDIGARALARADGLSSLTSLGLYHNHIGRQGALALLQSESLRALTDLDLGNNNILDEDIAMIEQSTARRVARW